MQNIIAIWNNLEPRRRLIAIAATGAMFAAVLFLGQIAVRPNMALLYAGLDGNRAGEVLTALDQRGVIYEVRGSAIYVASPARDELRMQLAAEGLPANSSAGYELLDELTGFGTTSQMFDAAYLRAKEGELARTILAQSSIRSARVHIANPQAQGLRLSGVPSASVQVTTVSGGLSKPHAKALRYLVASAIAGMAPDQVSIIDSDAGLIDGDSTDPAAGAEDRAAALKHNVERLLEARVGFGNAVVEVAVEKVTEREAITERRFDPDGRVAISTDTEEQSNSSSGSSGSSVTVASNLPSGDAAGGSDTAQSQNSQTRARTNFEVSETTRELLRSPGDIRRLSVAVLVDGVPQTDAQGAVRMEPRPDEELGALRDLVAAAVGYDESRGDVITVKSMGFEPGVVDPAPDGGLLAALKLDVLRLAQLAVLAIVALILGLFVLRPLLTSRGAVAPALAPPAPKGGEAAGRALTGEIADGDFDGDALPLVGAREAEGGERRDDPVARLRHLIHERQDETVEILRSWMEDPEEKTA